MSEFVRRWAHWTAPGAPGVREEVLSPEAPGQHTDKTAKTPFVSFVSGEAARLEVRTVLAGGVVEAQPSALSEAVMALSLVEFASAGLAVEVRSWVLDEVVLFASDNVRLDPGERRVVYRAAELRELVGLSPRDLRAVHTAKKLFGGSILPS